ncbi:hypothetical protein BDE36_1764 [Arcticibacter tournemirensis]|uniref:Uncharacterized protein n=1 Tax=Arcticibacter tournemirensis TaxID=699437 RepID=A0A5M9HBK6_9SPHI|nr:hypothetical protein [Arcticibacter tournemirensis]KAA8483769.1 hypothetical protein F1649_07730 [Arcticibacter tournemirensis]TQM50029.1 hypothetical protein BDE36_1764 [Arcticibacter tournemirensis]
MLTILNPSNLQMELAPDTTIPVVRENPLFNDSDKFVQETVYSVNAPFSPANKAFFNGGHRIDAPVEAYEFDIQVYDSGVHFFNGVCRYSTTSEGYEVELKVNIGAVADRIKSTRLPEIQTMDGIQFGNTLDALDNHMKNTAQNPDAYPYIFFDLRNTRLHNSDPGLSYNNVNYWKASGHRFYTYSEDNVFGFRTAESPFWKLTYVLKQLINFMGMEPEGSFFSDPEVRNVCIYTRKAILDKEIQPCFFYMPNMTVSDFIKQIRERFGRLCFDVDLASKRVTVARFQDILNSQDVEDITDYLSAVSEIDPPDQKGYTITLKPDSQDAAYDIEVSEGVKEKLPTYTITVGDGATKVEMSCTTLKFYPITSLVDPDFPGEELGVCQALQYVMKVGNYRREVGDGDPYTEDFQTKDGDPSGRNNWPLRLIRYKGIAGDELSDLPISEPVDLKPSDALWYQFLNDSKLVMVTASLPKTILARIRNTRKIGFHHLGVWHELVIKRLQYDLGKTEQLISVKIEGQSAYFERKTPVTVKRSDHVDEFVPPRFRAYWDPDQTGFDQIEIEVPVAKGLQWTVQPIKSPTDPWGAGGNGGLVSTVRVGHSSTGTQTYTELRIRKGSPKYVQALGKQFNFIYDSIANYYYAQVANLNDACIYWIVY